MVGVICSGSEYNGNTYIHFIVNTINSQGDYSQF